jgi:hypothetical protein
MNQPPLSSVKKGPSPKKNGNVIDKDMELAMALERGDYDMEENDSEDPSYANERAVSN